MKITLNPLCFSMLQYSETFRLPCIMCYSDITSFKSPGGKIQMGTWNVSNRLEICVISTFINQCAVPYWEDKASSVLIPNMYIPVVILQKFDTHP